MNDNERFSVISRLTHFFVVLAMVLATNAACFCWLQMGAESGCHAVKEMPNCCCDQEAEVTHEMPEHNVAVLPSVFYGVGNDVLSVAVDDLIFPTQEKFHSSTGHKRNCPLRSPPDLYVLHATFLI